jgi:hypothetical protein
LLADFRLLDLKRIELLDHDSCMYLGQHALVLIEKACEVLDSADALPSPHVCPFCRSSAFLEVSALTG